MKKDISKKNQRKKIKKSIDQVKKENINFNNFYKLYK